jgi:flagellar FliJ protein
MNAPSIESLTSLLELASAERDRATLALRGAEQQRRRLEMQAEQLGGYRAEYRQRWGGSFTKPSAMTIVHCYQGFMSRLDDAIGQQRQQLDQAAAAVERARAHLLACETRVASVRKLIERRQFEHRRWADRCEQRQTDETAQQSRWLAVFGADAQPTRH